jgi:hypothetical protein
MQTSLPKSVRDFHFRASPDYELVLFDRLSAREQEAFKGLSTDPDGYGILRPRQPGRLGIKSVSRDLALLFYTLQEPGVLPHYVRQSLGEQCDRAIAQMVLDGILEIDAGGTMVSGPAAHACLCPEESAADREGPMAALSRRALQYAQALDMTEAGLLSARLYDYNRIPASPRWHSLLPDRAAVGKLLDFADGAGTGALERSWTKGSGDEHWISWQAAGSNYDASRPVYKLYVSPAMTNLREAFQAAASVTAQSRAWSLKAGADVYGLLRPDKIVIYLKTFADLQETAERLLRTLSGCPGHGVPFSAELAAGTLLSWGIDPPRDSHSVPWLERQSWRSWVTNRLATALAFARDSPGCGIEPWRFAMERVRLEGVDTRTWTPSRN